MADAGLLASLVRRCAPGYFAVVMATGIVSTALQLAGYRAASAVLLTAAAVGFAGLAAASAVRLAVFPGVVGADLRDPDALMQALEITQVLDLTRPVAVLLVAVLHFLTDHDRPHAAVHQLMRDLPVGSALVLSHVTHDFEPEVVSQAADAYAHAAAPVVTRDRVQITGFFDGLTQLDPGLELIARWHPHGEPPANADRIWIYGGAAIKP